MEQMRLLIAITLSFAIFFLWSVFFAPKPQEQPEAIRQDSAEIKADIQTEQKSRPIYQDPRALPREQAEDGQTSRVARRITVISPLYRLTLSEEGASVISMVLNQYRESVEPQSPSKELISPELKGGTVLVALGEDHFNGVGSGLYTADHPSDTLDVSRQSAEIRFRTGDDQGLQIEKTYRFSPDQYLIGLSVKIFNGGVAEINEKLSISLADLMDKDSGSYSFEGPSAMVNSSLEQVKVKKINSNELIEGNIQWNAIESRYFMTSIIPKEAVKGRIKLDYINNRVSNQMILDHGNIMTNQEEKFEFDIFMGPKNITLLKSFGNNLDRAIDFGWVDILAKPCLWFMNFIHGFIPNYGVAIIILTIVTRLIFWPLANKSYKSMGEMRKLQPLMQEIREKHKNDRQRMNQEMMGLYKTYKINPMGGCLPMLIQLPVFFALYRMLYQAIELRHAPFIWWINDLSAPDRLFNFNFKIPFMEAPYGIPVLTLIMAATMFVQQKMTPTPGDPAQAKVMMFLPLIFLFIFINFSSGLVLYWMISNIISITQQYYIQNKVA